MIKKTLCVIYILLGAGILCLAIVGVRDYVQNPPPTYEEVMAWTEGSLSDTSRFSPDLTLKLEVYDVALCAAYLNSSLYEVLDTDDWIANVRVTVPDIAFFLEDYCGDLNNLYDQLLCFVRAPNRTISALFTLSYISDPDVYYVLVPNEELIQFISESLDCYINYIDIEMTSDDKSSSDNAQSGNSIDGKLAAVEVYACNRQAKYELLVREDYIWESGQLLKTVRTDQYSETIYYYEYDMDGRLTAKHTLAAIRESDLAYKDSEGVYRQYDDNGRLLCEWSHQVAADGDWIQILYEYNDDGSISAEHWSGEMYGEAVYIHSYSVDDDNTVTDTIHRVADKAEIADVDISYIYDSAGQLLRGYDYLWKAPMEYTYIYGTGGFDVIRTEYVETDFDMRSVTYACICDTTGFPINEVCIGSSYSLDSSYGSLEEPILVFEDGYIVEAYIYNTKLVFQYK